MSFILNPYRFAGVDPILLIGSASASDVQAGATTAAFDTTGATIFVAATAYLAGGLGGPVSDSETNTWTPLTEYASGAGNGRVRLYYAVAPTTSANHTFTVSGNQFPAIAVGAFSLVLAVSPFDQQNGSGTASATTQQPGSVTPTENNELLVTGLEYVDTATPGSATIDSGFTLLEATFHASNFSVALAYKVQTTAGAENPTWSSNVAADRMAAAIATFKHE